MNADLSSSRDSTARKRTSRRKRPARVAPWKLWGSERVWLSLAFQYPFVRRYRAAAFVAVFYTVRDALLPIKGGAPLLCKRSREHGSDFSRFPSVRWRTLRPETALQGPRTGFMFADVPTEARIQPIFKEMDNPSCDRWIRAKFRDGSLSQASTENFCKDLDTPNEFYK